VKDGTQVPNGYKQTEVGVIPEDWNVESLMSVTSPNMKNGIVDRPFGSNLKKLTQRVKKLLERYETLMSRFINRVSELESRVNRYLERLGFSWT